MIAYFMAIKEKYKALFSKGSIKIHFMNYCSFYIFGLMIYFLVVVLFLD